MSSAEIVSEEFEKNIFLAIGSIVLAIGAYHYIKSTFKPELQEEENN